MDRISTTGRTEEIPSSSAMGCRGAGGAYTRVKEPREASVEEGTTEPMKKATPDDCKYRREVVASDV
jgi:hypothetical protein